jgi:hypothetical protein
MKRARHREQEPGIRVAVQVRRRVCSTRHHAKDLKRHTCVFIEGKMFQNLRVSSPAPVTIVCVNGNQACVTSHVANTIFFLNTHVIIKCPCNPSDDLHANGKLAFDYELGLLPAHQVTLQGKAHAACVQLE